MVRFFLVFLLLIIYELFYSKFLCSFLGLKCIYVESKTIVYFVLKYFFLFFFEYIGLKILLFRFYFFELLHKQLIIVDKNIQP